KAISAAARQGLRGCAAIVSVRLRTEKGSAAFSIEPQKASAARNTKEVMPQIANKAVHHDVHCAFAVHYSVEPLQAEIDEAHRQVPGCERLADISTETIIAR